MGPFRTAAGRNGHFCKLTTFLIWQLDAMAATSHAALAEVRESLGTQVAAVELAVAELTNNAASAPSSPRAASRTLAGGSTGDTRIKPVATDPVEVVATAEVAAAAAATAAAAAAEAAAATRAAREAKEAALSLRRRVVSRVLVAWRPEHSHCHYLFTDLPNNRYSYLLLFAALSLRSDAADVARLTTERGSQRMDEVMAANSELSALVRS